MGFRTLIALTALGLAAAETTVVNLFIFDADPQSLVGSVVASSAGTTTYSINCAPSVDSQDCGFLPGLLYTAAPTSVGWNLRPPYDSYGTVMCSVGGTTTAVCTERPPTKGSLSRPGVTSTLGPEDISQLPVTITDGPSATTTASGTDASTTGTSTGGSGTRTTEGSGNTASQSASSPQQTTTSTAGLPQITADPRVVVGGAVAALVAVVL